MLLAHCIFLLFQVVYYLQELDGDDDLFSISTVNGKGVLRLAGHLDYERKFLYQIRVLAVDRAINERVGLFVSLLIFFFWYIFSLSEHLMRG